MRGVLVAGGRGERLASATDGLPKCLLPVLGVTIADALVARLAAAGAREIFVLAHHGADLVDRHFRRPRPEAAVTVVREPEPLGTIGGLSLLPPPTGTTLVANGDLVTALDFARLLEVHRRRRADLTIATHQERVRLRLGEVVATVRGRVRAYLEKPEKRVTISSGIYALEPGIAGLVAPGERLAFPELVLRALERRFEVLAHADDAFWIDVNESADLAAAEEEARRDPSLLARAR